MAIKNTIFALALTLLLCSHSASAQMSPNWDMRNREKSESNTMAAVSLLAARQTDRALAALNKAINQDPTDAVAQAIVDVIEAGSSK